MKNYRGVSSEAIYDDLAKGVDRWARYSTLEEWSCLAPAALRYYMQPYLLYLMDTIEAANPDDQFLFDFYCLLIATIKLHGTDVFSAAQRQLLDELSRCVLIAMRRPEFEVWRQDIEERVNAFSTALGTASAA